MNHNDINKYALIDKYLTGGMTPNELDSFKAFLQSDKDFTAELNIISELQEASRFDKAQSDLRDTLSQIRANDVNVTDSVPKSSNSLIYKVLGGLVLLFVAMYFVVKLMASTTGLDKTPDLSQYAYVEPLELITKSNDVDVSKMQTLFNEGDYNAAMPLINSFLNDNPRDLDVLLAKGMAQTELKQYDAAHKTYLQIQNMGPRVKKYLWFDALCYIKEGNTAKAETLLQHIVTEKSYNHADANHLLQNLN